MNKAEMEVTLPMGARMRVLKIDKLDGDHPDNVYGLIERVIGEIVPE